MIHALIALLLSVSAYAKTPLEGLYMLSGNSASQPEVIYYGSVNVTKEGANYKLKWKIGRDQTQSGVAILTSDVLSVGYYDDSGKDFGVVSYSVKSDKKMEGKWAPLGATSFGKETLEYVGDDSAATTLKLAEMVHKAHGKQYAKPKSVEDFENKLILETNAEKKFDLLSAIVKEYASIKIKDKKIVKERADALLEMAQEYKNDWNYGNAIHHSHLVLGRLRLAEGDKDAAKAELKKAGQTPGSPQLNSFGPNMTLAKELLAKGEKTAVLEYFNDVLKFWTIEHAKPDVDAWTKAIEQGKTPDFRGNLVY